MIAEYEAKTKADNCKAMVGATYDNECKLLNGGKIHRERNYIHMPEFSRILIEEYCMNHPKTKKSKFLWKMVKMS